MGRKFFVRRNLARLLLLKLSRWKTVGEVPKRKGILVGRPAHVQLGLGAHHAAGVGQQRADPAPGQGLLLRGAASSRSLSGPTGAVELDRANPGATVPEPCWRMPRPTRRSCSASRPRAPAARVSTGSPASTGSRSRPASRSPSPSWTRRRGRSGWGPTSPRRVTWWPTWTASASSSPTRPASGPEAHHDPSPARGGLGARESPDRGKLRCVGERWPGSSIGLRGFETGAERPPQPPVVEELAQQASRNPSRVPEAGVEPARPEGTRT